MPLQLDYLTGKAEAENHILPADLRQAAIGPGMAIYSRYNSIQTLDGQSVTVQDALRLINNTVARYLDRQISDLEPETRFCIEWLQAYQNEEGLYQAAENMALTYSISVADRLDREHGLLTAQQGNVKLHSLDNYDESNNPIKPNQTQSPIHYLGSVPPHRLASHHRRQPRRPSRSCSHCSPSGRPLGEHPYPRSPTLRHSLQPGRQLPSRSLQQRRRFLGRHHQGCRVKPGTPTSLTTEHCLQ